MLDRMKTAGAVLAMTLPLAFSAQGLRAEEDQANAADTTAAMTGESQGGADAAPSNGMKTFDALAVRPVTFVSSVFSTGAFVLALPFAALDPAMDVEKTRKNLVEEPFRDTFQRPLGDFNGSAWGDP
jgi:hypothetical protein